jgi:hypothetical protein
MKKFTQIPIVIYEDIVRGDLIGNDLVVYNYLVTKASHGKPIFFSNKQIGNELGGMSYGKISASLNRLVKAGHVSRRKTCNKCMTQLKTLVTKNREVMIKGVLS